MPVTGAAEHLALTVYAVLSTIWVGRPEIVPLVGLMVIPSGRAGVTETLESVPVQDAVFDVIVRPRV
jgi:hypothetical protein